ncbi:YdeI/OmpD-associated family protein [Rubritalea sp.]|uniref:YdeI/OmpD-associated family protein n=1 Tax=Rubritalea sp. TaxID=2109375 RepID=UPI003EF5E0EC
MLEADPSKIKAFQSPTDLHAWLEVHHASETELWVQIFKKGSKITSVTWNEVVIECLCWGWIDGIKKSLDEQAYLQRITPRKRASNWSKRNTEHVERLIREGRMHEAGLVHVRAAKEDSRWKNAYKVSEIKVPTDFLAALEKHPAAKEFYDSLTKSNHYVIANGLESAKKPETRLRRFQKFMDMLSRGEKPS